MAHDTTVPEIGVPRSKTGYIGSLLIHLSVVGLAVLCASLAHREAVEVEDHDPLLLEVWQGDGSDRAPGIPGRDRGIADGVATGDKSKVGRGGFARLRSINASALLKEMRDNEAKAAAEAKAVAAQAAKEAASEKSAPSTDKNSKTSAKEKWSPDYLKNGASKTGSKSGSASGKASAGGKSSGGASGIKGASTGGSGTGTGKGSGADGFGRAGGKGKNGGDGGSGDAVKLFVGDVKGKFADIYIPMFREQGGELGAASDGGKVRVVISPSGLVSFGGWVRRPIDPLMERIVLDAIRKMRPVRPPPGGEETAVSFEVKGEVDE